MYIDVHAVGEAHWARLLRTTGLAWLTISVSAGIYCCFHCAALMVLAAEAESMEPVHNGANLSHLFTEDAHTIRHHFDSSGEQFGVTNHAGVWHASVLDDCLEWE
jgi:hypothetical protein